MLGKGDQIMKGYIEDQMESKLRFIASCTICVCVCFDVDFDMFLDQSNKRREKKTKVSSVRMARTNLIWILFEYVFWMFDVYVQYELRNVRANGKTIINVWSIGCVEGTQPIDMTINGI